MIRTAAIVGTGLIGTSVGLALARHGVRVHLLDADASTARVAAALGAGTTVPPPGPVDLAVIAVPPTRVADVLCEQQRRSLALSYTDVASVKLATARAVAHASPERADYVGGHPMAGSERSGPLTARAGLFEGRPWVLTPDAHTSADTLNRALAAVALCGAVPVVMEPDDHDRAVAVVSHTPHLLAALMASRLRAAPPEVRQLVGQGLRDVTRIAGGAPTLWTDILRSNARAVAEILEELSKDLETLVRALREVALGDPHAAGAMAPVTELLSRGREGWAAVHGTDRDDWAVPTTLEVSVGEQPGALGRLLLDITEFGVGPEKVRLHGGDGPAALAALIVAEPVAAETLRKHLAASGWPVRYRPPSSAEQPQPSGAPPR